MMRHTIFIYVQSSWWKSFSLVTAIIIPTFVQNNKTSVCEGRFRLSTTYRPQI